MRRLTVLAFAVLALAAGPAGAGAAAFGTDGASRIVWKQVFASPQDDWINQIVPLRDGAYLAVGFLGRDDKAAAPDWRALAVKFTAGGRVLWRREYGQGAGVDAFWSAAEAKDGRIVTAGFTSRIGAGGIDAWAAVLGPDGELTGESAFGGPGYDRATDIAATPDGGFVLVGHTQRPRRRPRRAADQARWGGQAALAAGLWRPGRRDRPLCRVHIRRRSGHCRRLGRAGLGGGAGDEDRRAGRGALATAGR